MKKLIVFLPILSLALFVLVSKAFAIRPGETIEQLFKKARPVLVINPSPIPVEVVNQSNNQPSPEPTPNPTPEPQVQQWEHWYQCHPNPTNEAEIRGYINDRGRDGFEVVAAAGVGGLICEYYKRPKP